MASSPDPLSFHALSDRYSEKHDDVTMSPDCRSEAYDYALFPILQEHFSFMLKEDRQRGPKIYEIHTMSLTQNRFCCLGGSQNNFLGWIREMMPNFTTCSHTITNAAPMFLHLRKDVGVPASAESCYSTSSHNPNNSHPSISLNTIGFEFTKNPSFTDYRLQEDNSAGAYVATIRRGAAGRLEDGLSKNQWWYFRKRVQEWVSRESEEVSISANYGKFGYNIGYNVEIPQHQAPIYVGCSSKLSTRIEADDVSGRFQDASKPWKLLCKWLHTNYQDMEAGTTTSRHDTP
ncbi:uncharacterized protein RAG0_16045 [Rhynchosporium agropyri]|uniref:Uncharacterized protein n=1 Tax=Rhynchosporium agropyri TaxID=914238 RepID=A0A1E1LNK2_9HELO|nr:uncharacterized protein RAG0_16045 [Rhynchosporium agropyri]